MLALNVKAVFHLTRVLLPLLEAAAGSAATPRASSTSARSTACRCPLLETYAYSASKAAVHHLTRVLAQQARAARITVNASRPGPFESKMMARDARDASATRSSQSCPLGRIGEPEDMAGVAIYLASRAGAYVTGAVIPVDGGISTTR